MAVDDRFADFNPKTCVVLGGTGFLGRSLVLRLLKLGNWIVRVADSAHSIQLHDSESLLAQALSSARASYFHIDLRDKRNIAKVLEGSSVVFYMDVASIDVNDFYTCYTLIVQGAKNVISACRECRVRRLIYNSSADVVFDGLHDIHDGDESLAYPWKIDDMLSDLKAQAEALVLSVNDIDGLLTCSLRPSNVFGPGDTKFVPYFLKLARYGFAKFIIGTGDNLSDFTFSENVTHAHICAEKALNFQTVSVAGKAFFITNLEPMKFWEFLSILLDGLGYQRPFIKLPANLVQYILSVLKWLHEKLGPRYFSYPLLAHFFQLALYTRTFNCLAAQKDIGYSPIVSLEEGVALTIESFSHLARDSSFSRCCSGKQSKADKLLGGGKVADILLWRDEKKSFTYFLVMVLLFYWFFLSGRTFISSAARLLLFATLVFYGHGFLPSKLFGLHIQRIPMSCFKISDTVVKDSVTTTVYIWNKVFQNIRGLAQGDDWSTFFKIAVFLYVLKLILSKLLTILIGIGLVFSFMAFFVYEQYESEIDGLVDNLFISLKEFMIYLMRISPVSISRLQHYEGPRKVKDLR
ncbi:3beta-hydroxysteroid-dehydrogenase/decarboxylase [Cajanus cajan]|uniref:Reticulon-like protein n=1 Tax=Cajanus cajan TaxID=3821 RepID=A0A151TG18_CAJCA|nr:3beta-hydroxysteroid-dehydrogenase/decarboxylase [Cajanus cajan]KYP65990.1 3beta-hydroxysteroid-dehydrogenase/decarboxylase isoform 3 [Cajanus cajan]